VERHECKSPRTHVRERPDAYVGSREAAEASTRFVLDVTPSAAATGGGYAKRGVAGSWRVVAGGVSDAFEKVFDEVWTNALDRVIRDPSVTKLSCTVSSDGVIAVRNDGAGIPVKKMAVVAGGEATEWVPEVVMSRFMSGSNFDAPTLAGGAAAPPRFTGGRNGLGAKLTGILSTEFTVETADAVEHKRFKQTWTGGLRHTAGARVTAFSGAAATKGYTLVTFKPDYAWFGMAGGLTPDAKAVLRTRVLLSAACNTARPVAVEWNGGDGDAVALPAGLRLGLPDVAAAAAAAPGVVSRKQVPHATVVLHGVQRAAIAALPRPAACRAEAMGFVNSVRTDEGTHVRWAQARIADAVVARLRGGAKQHADLPLTPGMVCKALLLVVAVFVDSPAFNSQAKDALNTPARAWGFDWQPEPAFVEGVVALVGAELLAEALRKQNRGAATALGVSDAKRRAAPVIPKYDPALDLGKGGCTLGLAEGDSAKALLVSMHLGPKFGIFPLRGKLKNARGLSAAQLAANAELSALIKIIGLEPGADYSSAQARDRLFYANVMLFVDQDPDGAHIAGLLLNFFATQWPSLLAAAPNFVQRFRTPLLAVVPAGPAFFTRADFEAWRATAAAPSAPKVKYYKGLGTSTASEGRRYAADMAKHVQVLTWTLDCAPDVDAAFNDKAAPARRALIAAPRAPQAMLSADALTYSQFIRHDLVEFFVYANKRAIPSFIDGLKVVQRKVLHALLARGSNAEMRVCDAVGYVSSHSKYHHGDAALGETIMHMMQNHVGSNNINLLNPLGQAGTRLADRGTHASTRYVHTCLEPVTAALFQRADGAVLPLALEDGEEAEPAAYAPVLPLLLLNGAEGLGVGWSTTVHPRDPLAVLAAVRAWVAASAAGGDAAAAAAGVPLPPHWDGWTGSVTPDATKAATYVVRGRATRRDDGWVHISELPPGTWTDDYLTALRAREELTVKNNPDEARIDILVKGVPPEEADLCAYLKLQDAVRDSNMHGFDAAGRLVKAETPHDILDMHARVRLDVYAKRKAAQLAALLEAQHTLEAKLQFITSVISGAFTPFFKTKLQLRTDLVAAGYAEALLPVLAAIRTDQYCADEVGALRDAVTQKRVEREALAAQSVHALWLADLDEFEAAYARFKADKQDRYTPLVRAKAVKRKNET
jgi:DNA topoisomerase-2